MGPGFYSGFINATCLCASNSHAEPGASIPATNYDVRAEQPSNHFCTCNVRHASTSYHPSTHIRDLVITGDRNTAKWVFRAPPYSWDRN